MAAFTKLETEALRSIFSETPDLAPALEQQLQRATVTDRRNTGHGFFTTIAVADDAPLVSSPSLLGYETHAKVGDLEHGVGFVLFMREGRLHMLEGYSKAIEDTAALDLETLPFEIFREPIIRLPLRRLQDEP